MAAKKPAAKKAAKKAKKLVQAKPVAKKSPGAKAPAKTRSKRPAKTPAKASSKSAPKKRSATKKIEPPKVKALFGISTDKGVLVAVSTPADAPELSDFALAAKDPFPRRVPAPRAKGRLANAVIRDEPTQSDVRVYLAFLPVPTGFPVAGQMLYGATISHPKEDIFFTAITELVSKIEGTQLAKILVVLEKPFGEILPSVFGPEHSLTKVYLDLIEKKRALEFWKATQARVEELLRASQSKEALAVLEPLVYQKLPHAQAEKLLGDILWRSYLKEKPDQAGDDASRQVTTERLLFQYLLKVIGVAPASTA